MTDAELVQRLREALRDLLEVTERQDAEWDSPAALDERMAIHARAHAALAVSDKRATSSPTPGVP